MKKRWSGQSSAGQTCSTKKDESTGMFPFRFRIAKGHCGVKGVAGCARDGAESPQARRRQVRPLFAGRWNVQAAAALMAGRAEDLPRQPVKAPFLSTCLYNGFAAMISRSRSAAKYMRPGGGSYHRSSQGPAPSRTSNGSPPVQSITVEASILPIPLSITRSTCFSNTSCICSGSV